MVKLVIGVMYSNKYFLKETKERLKEKFGEIKNEINYDFNFTRYYEEEMGKNLKKNIIVFKQSIKKEQLPRIKNYITKVEDKYRIKGKRKINIDPGYLTKKELKLISSKKSPYKVKIGKNVYAHLTLKFKNNKCITTHRTYPDFKTKKVQNFLLKSI